MVIICWDFKKVAQEKGGVAAQFGQNRVVFVAQFQRCWRGKILFCVFEKL
jgi:hypothetical protein